MNPRLLIPALLALLSLGTAQAQDTTAPQRLFQSVSPAPGPDPFGLQAFPRAPRQFPAQARLVSLTPGVFPLVDVDGTALRFSAGALVRDASDMQVMPASLQGRTWPAMVLVDAAGEVHRAWLLTNAELQAAAARR